MEEDTIKTKQGDEMPQNGSENVVRQEEVIIKCERIETEENVPLFIKLEPMDTASTDVSNENAESIIVKIEPTYYENDEQEFSEPQLNTRRQTSGASKKYKADSDEEYIPPKRKKKKQPNVKPAFRGKTKRDECMLYSDDVTNRIEILTITEEERRKEVGENLNLRKHMAHMCEWCAIGFVLEEAYLMHMKIHSPESGDYECDLCRARLKSQGMLYRHRLRHYRRYRCKICHMIHKDKDTAASHIMTEHRHKSFLCPMCSKGFKRPQYLQRHIDQHHTKLLQFECPECKRIFHERSRYRSHVRTHNELIRTKRYDPVVICAICMKQYRNKGCLKRHLKTHLGTVCILCCVTFGDEDSLEEHFKNVHKTFYNRSERGVPCAACGRRCASEALLRRHQRRMHQDRTKKYQCDECKRMYLTKAEVRSHIEWSHVRVAAHKCALCARVFRSPARLRAHVRADHLREPAPRTHVCARCQKAFVNNQVLQRHMRVHSDQRYACKECGLSFKTEPYVQVHYKLKHLNMTRAQIKEQIQRRKAQSINLVKPTIKVMKVEPTTNFQNVKHENISNADTFLPMFQTFVDVKKDILEVNGEKESV